MPKVLLIDDSKTIQKVAALILKGSAYRLVVAEDSEAGKQLALREKPDIALVDFTLGPQNGLDLIREFSIEPALQGMRSALLYSHFKNLNSSDLEKSGAKGKLAKPFDAKEFLNLLNQISQPFIQPSSQPSRPDPSMPEPSRGDEISEMTTTEDPLKNLFTEEEVDKCFNFLEKPLAFTTAAKDPVVSTKIATLRHPEERSDEGSRRIVSTDDPHEQVSKDTVEKICREVIPPLAEKIIREEIQKLIKESR
jgi:CheY-like chemotaxis protein